MKDQCNNYYELVINDNTIKCNDVIIIRHNFIECSTIYHHGSDLNLKSKVHRLHFYVIFLISTYIYFVLFHFDTNQISSEAY